MGDVLDRDQKPMLAALVRELPKGDFAYEPKWDGFRCLAFRDGQDLDMRSRHGRPLGRYFPELAGALLALGQQRFALDGEVLVLERGRFDFARLMARLHPAESRVRELARRTPAIYVAFDLLAVRTEDLRAAAFDERRARLEDLAPLAAPIAGHPWDHGFLLGGGPMGRLKGAAGRWQPGMTMDWIPVAPQRVCEVTYTQVDGRRLRHPAKFKRWRADREPRSCRVEQLDDPLTAPAQVLGT